MLCSEQDLLIENNETAPSFNVWKLIGLTVNMFQDLEYELGEVEFRDGIPDVKFSRVRMDLLKNCIPP